MKNIYFIQVGFDFDGSVYLPYAVGTMAAYCLADEKLNKEYAFPDFIYRREKLDDALSKIKDPYIAAFSCSVWNMEFNKTLAKRVKEKYPECIVIFGGHSVRENDCSLLESESYVDILMYGEGEKTFADILAALPADALGTVENIAFRKGTEYVRTERSVCSDLSNHPSPYLTGVFDKIMDENPGADWLAVLETNRGCPYSCAYCDWCAGKKMRHFLLEKVLGEIDWFAKNEVEYIFCADSNFGMFDRDVEIAEYLVASKRKTGYPKVFRPCYEKNSADRVFNICRILNSEGMDKGATMAYQTLSDDALKNIGRKNLTMEHFSSLLQRYNEAGIPTYSELILGLPGETKESFCEGICRLLENGQHNSINVYHCEMLPNSDMSEKSFVEKHGIKEIKVPFNHIHSAIKRDEEVQEYSYLVRATATLPEEDWVYANLFSITVQCFHSLGFLRLFSIYLNYEKNVKYIDFFTGLLDFILNSDGRLGVLWRGFREKYESSLSGDWNYHNEKFGNVTWFFEEGAFLELVCEPDAYMNELLPYLKTFDIGDELFKQMLVFQRHIVRIPSGGEAEITSDWDIFSFYTSVIGGSPEPLRKRKTTVRFCPSVTYDDIETYARETVWFGRRRGAAMLHGKEMIRL